eukprot:1182731-Prorocentrum_minimum.AAC.2
MEIKNDGLMKRTMMRPLPSGRCGPRHAAAFAAVMGIGGVSLLAWKVGFPDVVLQAKMSKTLPRCKLWSPLTPKRTAPVDLRRCELWWISDQLLDGSAWGWQHWAVRWRVHPSQAN